MGCGARLRLTAAALLAAASVPPVAASPAGGANTGRADVAALQVALKQERLYAGPIDGLYGAGTAAAVRVVERRAGLAPTGELTAGLRLLGEAGRSLGSRVLAVPSRGWDVAELQFVLAWRGFPSGPFTGEYTERTAAAVRRFQRSAGLIVDGVAGPRTIAAVRSHPRRSPLHLHSPLLLSPAEGFGPRGDRFHTGLDFPAAAGTPVRAAGPGLVTYAAWHPGGWGYLVTIAHGRGVRTMSAHLSRLWVQVGQRVRGGDVVGAVGSSGLSVGPHLHFEVRLRGAAIDPVTAF